MPEIPGGRFWIKNGGMQDAGCGMQDAGCGMMALHADARYEMYIVHPPHHPVTLLPCYLVTLLLCYFVTLLPHYPVTF